MIRILRQCKRELEDLPGEIREDLADALSRLEEGQKLSMPLSRPMPSIGKNIHELRLKDRTGAYRVFYFLRVKHEIVLLHAFKKKAQQTPFHVIEVVRKRLKEV